MNDTEIWNAYNLLLAGPDTERLRKLLARYELFRRTQSLPGDIVEAGIFKGTGLMTWMKLLAIFAPGSAKRVVAFDLFEGFAESAAAHEKQAVQDLLAEAAYRPLRPADIHALIEAAGLPQERCEVLAGDIAESAPRYVDANPGFRISLLHLDLDLEAPTLAALRALWPRVVPGGLVVFDEYAIPKWSESAAVDTWLASSGLRLRSLPWARTPTAYAIKS